MRNSSPEQVCFVFGRMCFLKFQQVHLTSGLLLKIFRIVFMEDLFVLGQNSFFVKRVREFSFGLVRKHKELQDWKGF